jgi:hypothetical protein
LTTRQIALWYLTGTRYDYGTNIVNDAGPEWKLVGTGDFNGDGWSDLLWQDEVAGQKAMWFMQNNNRQSSSLFGSQYATWPQTKMYATGRFDGDSKSDIVWRGTAGNCWIWYMDGATVKASLAIVKTNNDVVCNAVHDVPIVGADDFMPSGGPDLLFRNMVIGQNLVYEMSGSSNHV